MTIQEKRQWLARAYHLNNGIEKLRETYDMVISENIYTSPSFGDKVQKSAVNSSENKAIKVTEVAEQIDKLIKKKRVAYQEILTAIETLDSELEKNVLTEKYINMKPVHIIARDMSYSEGHVKRLLAQGVENLSI